MCAAHFWASFQGRWTVYRYVFADLLFCQFWPIRYWKETVYTFSCPALDTLFILKINAFSHFPGSGQDPNLKLTFFFFFFWGCLKAAETSCKHNTDIQTVTFQVDIVSSFFFLFFYIQQLWSNIIFQVMSQIVCGSITGLKCWNQFSGNHQGTPKLTGPRQKLVSRLWIYTFFLYR